MKEGIKNDGMNIDLFKDHLLLRTKLVEEVVKNCEETAYKRVEL